MKINAKTRLIKAARVKIEDKNDEQLRQDVLKLLKNLKKDYQLWMPDAAYLFTFLYNKYELANNTQVCKSEAERAKRALWNKLSACPEDIKTAFWRFARDTFYMARSYCDEEMDEIMYPIFDDLYKRYGEKYICIEPYLTKDEFRRMTE